MNQLFNYIFKTISSLFRNKSKKSLVIVGNASLDSDFSEIIDSCDCVVRFNDCRNYNINSGIKTDILILTNTGDPSTHQTLKVMLKNRTKAEVKEELPYLKNIKQVWFVRPDLVFLYNFFKNNFPNDHNNRNQELKELELIKQRNIVSEIINAQKIQKIKITIISKEMYNSTWEKLLFSEPIDANAIMPSTGSLGVEMILDNPIFDNYEKYIVGFTWEGWNGHLWQAEKALIHNYIKNGVLKILS